MKKRFYLLTVFIAVILNASPFYGGIAASDSVTFIGGELLGRPEANSIVINICTNLPVDFFYEYGTDSLTMLNQTPTARTADSIPKTITLSNLQPNTRYYYRLNFRDTSSVNYQKHPCRSFITQRPYGTPFTFAVEADPHMDTNSVAAVYTLTLKNILGKQPDFLIDLGDTFMSEKLPVINQEEIKKRHMLLRSFFDIACHSVPLFLVQGNHDGELGWRLDSTADNLPVWQTNIRKQYYPNPVPDNFYTGNSIPEKYVGLRENYYSWKWGDALFIVIDPYWYTKTKPGWGWTLGPDQYNWFKNVLANSREKFKFVFAHQLVGGNGNDARGGSEYAHLFEMGGRNLDSTWGFNSFRQGWEKPIHELLVQYGVDIYFHGHDHFYGRQEKDGVIYQEVPQPSLKNYQSFQATNYGYLNGIFFANRGYLLLTMTDSSARVDYIRTYLPTEENASRHNGDITHSYTILKTVSAVEVNKTGPAGFELKQNYPNPFNPETTIQYVLPAVGNVELKIYSTLGEEVQTLINNKFQEAGTHNVKFTIGKSRHASAIYIYTLRCGSYTQTRKMVYLK